MSVGYASWRMFRDRAANLTAAESAISDYVVAAEPSNMHRCDGWAGCRVRFVGRQALANSTITVAVYTVATNAPATGTAAEFYIFRHCSVVARMGNQTGINESDNLCDEVVITDLGNVAVDAALGLETAKYGTAVGNNDIGELVIGNLGGAYGLMFRYTAFSLNATQANAMLTPIME
jgi:hypothetical protein